MSISVLKETAKLYYEDQGLMGKQIDEVLFPTLDESTNTMVKVDEFTGQPFTARAIVKGQPANVREFVNGSGSEWEPPIVKEKTPIDEALDDAVIVGNEASAAYTQQATDLINKIIDGPKGHVVAHKMARAKAAIDVYRTGIFSLPLENGGTVEFDYGRATDLGNMTADFTASDTIDSAIKEMYTAMKAYGVPSGQLAILMGSSWYSEFQSDSTVIAKRQSFTAANLINESMKPAILEGAEGLYYAGDYNVDGMAFPVKILVYEPDWQYLATNGGTSTAYMPADEAVMFNLGGAAWRVNRGVTVLDDNGAKTREVGDIVFDSYTDNDPVVDWLRSNARFMYVRGNINHTARMTGTFS